MANMYTAQHYVAGLAELQILLDNGAINQQRFNERKNALIDKVGSPQLGVGPVVAPDGALGSLALAATTLTSSKQTFASAKPEVFVRFTKDLHAPFAGKVKDLYDSYAGTHELYCKNKSSDYVDWKRHALLTECRPLAAFQEGTRLVDEALGCADLDAAKASLSKAKQFLGFGEGIVEARANAFRLEGKMNATYVFAEGSGPEFCDKVSGQSTMKELRTEIRNTCSDHGSMASNVDMEFLSGPEVFLTALNPPSWEATVLKKRKAQGTEAEKKAKAAKAAKAQRKAEATAAKKHHNTRLAKQRAKLTGKTADEGED